MPERAKSFKGNDDDLSQSHAEDEANSEDNCPISDGFHSVVLVESAV